MNQVTERKRLRREYVRKKAQAYISCVTAGALFVPLLLITVALALPALGLLAFSVIQFLIRPAENSAALVMILPALFLGMLASLPGLFTCMCWDALKDAKRDTHIPHVPPVTANSLPVEEVLVRSSVEPPVTRSDVLLRAAQAGQETSKEELLRVSQGE